VADMHQKANKVEQMIRDLEASIARYKEEYAVLISEAQAIKADLAAVEAKVNRSTALLKSLSAERERWEKTSETFKNQMSTIAGDCLLSAAFIAYAGYFDQQMRQNLFTTWSHHRPWRLCLWKGSLESGPMKPCASSRTGLWRTRSGAGPTRTSTWWL